MSSIVTAVPSGIIQDWCIKPPWFDGQLEQCANATIGTKESDFQTICCDGTIIDTTRDLFSGSNKINMADLVCCRIEGPQAGGFGPPLMGPQTTCASGVPVPLTSLAATNTLNAQDYLVTYTSASFGGPTPGDFIPTTSPYCLWANTKDSVVMTTITVPAAKITTLSSSTYDLPVISRPSSPSDIIVTPSDTSGPFITSSLSSTPSPSNIPSSSVTDSVAAQSTSTNSAASSRTHVSIAQSCLVGLFCLAAVDLWSRAF